MLRRGQSAVPPTLEGVSLVAYLSPPRESESGTSRIHPDETGCWLLLGSARNALAAVLPNDDHDAGSATTTSSSLSISHIISVADHGNAQSIQREANRHNSAIHISCHAMADRLRPDQIVDWHHLLSNKSKSKTSQSKSVLGAWKTRWDLPSRRQVSWIPPRLLQPQLSPTNALCWSIAMKATTDRRPWCSRIS